ncbi:MAG TPA: PKD domain-containing protein [Thermoplasmata archaeon]|nr:PKD domain-containing protein [Thermoplasmata archaeon]
MLICPRCGAPLPLPGWDGFVTCGYCGVRSEVSRLHPAPRVPAPPEETGPPLEPPLQPTEGDYRWGGSSTIVRAVIALILIGLAVAAVVFAGGQPGSSPAGSYVAHCSVTIEASATSGPAPFTATFTADVTTPPGVSTSEPMWQFGPFGPGFDLNYTYGSSVTHTWDTNGSYGVHVTVPDSTGQGCWTTMSVDVT